MKNKIAIVTDTNSGITQEEAKKLGIYLIAMPFFINDNTYYEGITLSQEEFFKKLEADENISTSQPSPGTVIELWDNLLKDYDYDYILHIPMSSGLSSSMETARMLSSDYEGKVLVVDNKRISVTFILIKGTECALLWKASSGIMTISLLICTRYTALLQKIFQI